MKKESLNQKIGNKGITLIMLIGIIIVFLVIVGVAIAILFNNNITKESGETSDSKININNVETKKGLLVDIKAKFAKYTDETSSISVPIPGGFCVVNDSKTNGNNKNTIASGLVISDLSNDTLDNEIIDGKRGNQFVWIPVNEEKLKQMYGIDSEGKKHGKLYKFGNIEWNNSKKAYEMITYDTPQAFNWSEINGTMSITNTNYSNSNREPDILTSYDGTDATNNASDFKVAISETMTGSEFKAQLEREFNEMIASVQKYGGFYIGRYETGNLSNSDNTIKAVVQKGAKVGEANWYYQYQEIKNMANGNSNITTSMIWGCQFDRTLEWIAETNQKDGKPDYSLLTNSSNWGNYSDYKEVTGDESISEAGTKVLPSGTNEAWQKNHIYDLAGNSWDWTIESEGTYSHTGHRRKLY